MFIIFLVIIIAFGVLIFLLSLQDTGYITIDKSSLNLLYILLGVLFVILLVVYLLKVFVINKLENNDLEKKEEVKIINNFTEDEEDNT